MAVGIGCCGSAQYAAPLCRLSCFLTGFVLLLLLLLLLLS
jgi:hypothetical protein